MALNLNDDLLCLGLIRKESSSHSIPSLPHNEIFGFISEEMKKKFMRREVSFFFCLIMCECSRNKNFSTRKSMKEAISFTHGIFQKIVASQQKKKPHIAFTRGRKLLGKRPAEIHITVSRRNLSLLFICARPLSMAAAISRPELTIS